MRIWKNVLTLTLLGVAAGSAAAQSQPANQTQPQSTPAAAGPVVTVDQAIDRITAREREQIATFRRFSPIIETYIQEMKSDKDMGAVPVKDHYFLGQADRSEEHTSELQSP